MGLVGPLVRDNAEWSSALLVHAGIENRICGIIRLRARGGSGRGGIDPEGLEVRGSGQQYFFCHHPILLIFFIKFSVLREGVCRETRGGHTTPAPHSWDEIVGTPLHQERNEPSIGRHTEIALAGFSVMEARGAGPVTEWVVKEDARWILLSPPPGAFGERSVL